MTCIAYKDGVMAADSKCTDYTGMFITKSQKLFRLPNKSVLGTAGDADVRLLFEVLGKASLKRLPSKADLAITKTCFSGLWAWPNGTLYAIDIEPREFSGNHEWDGQLYEIVERCASAGSGGSYAMGAMLAGKSAVEAVSISCKLDSFCQMPVKSIVVKDIGTKKI